MSIELRPEIIDTNGFRRRGWVFGYKGQKYYIQETVEPYYVAQQVANNNWQPLSTTKTKTIILAFEQEKLKTLDHVQAKPL